MPTRWNFRVAERDPSGRYARYDKIIANYPAKRVYMGFDGIDGIQISWTKIALTNRMLKHRKFVESLCAEANLLKSLDHENVVRCYESWIDYKEKTIHMITEHFSSGSLEDYLGRHVLADNTTAIKNWCGQILRGLDYLHHLSPPIIHRDVKCGNIYVNGNTGTVKLGDFRRARNLDGEVISIEERNGEPQFMAPELLIRGQCTQAADIYSFGMCVLQMVTKEPPYSECQSKNLVYRKVKSGLMPVALSNITDPDAKQFIQRCLTLSEHRPPAIELLSDSFLAFSVSSTAAASSSLSLAETVRYQVARLLPKNFKLRGRMKGNDSIRMSLWIDDKRKLKFDYPLEGETTEEFLQRVTAELDLLNREVREVSEIMDLLITEIIRSSQGGRRNKFEISNTGRQEIRRVNPFECAMIPSCFKAS